MLQLADTKDWISHWWVKKIHKNHHKMSGLIAAIGHNSFRYVFNEYIIMDIIYAILIYLTRNIIIILSGPGICSCWYFAWPIGRGVQVAGNYQ